MQHITIDAERRIVDITRTCYQRVCKRIRRIGIRRTKSTYGYVRFRILGNRRSGQQDISRSFIDIRDVDHKCLFCEQSSLIRRAHSHRITRLGFEIKTVCCPQRPTDDFKRCVVGVSHASDNRISEQITYIEIGGAEVTDCCRCHRVLGNYTRGYLDICWCYIRNLCP